MKKERVTKTTIYETKDGSEVWHTVVWSRPEKVVFGNGSEDIVNWDSRGEFIDFAPKGNFITKFFKRLKALKQLEALFTQKEEKMKNKFTSYYQNRG